jgi:translin
MINIDELSKKAQAALAGKHLARESALPRSRATIRLCANTIRAIHRNEFEPASRLLQEARDLLRTMENELRDYPDIYYAGFVEDAQKEFAEASATLALIQDHPLPEPTELGIGWAPYLNGLGEAVGELRRHTLNELRHGNFAHCENMLVAMDEILALLASLDYPDAITNNLRRTADTARGIIEKTRGDVTAAVIQSRLSDQLTELSHRLSASTSSNSLQPPRLEEESV